MKFLSNNFHLNLSNVKEFELLSFELFLIFVLNQQPVLFKIAVSVLVQIHF